MALKHVLKMFGLVAHSEHEELKRKHATTLSDLKDDLRVQREMKRQLQKEIGNFLIDIGRISDSGEYDRLGRKLRGEDNLSSSDISEGVKLLYSWLEREIETKSQTTS